MFNIHNFIASKILSLKIFGFLLSLQPLKSTNRSVSSRTAQTSLAISSLVTRSIFISAVWKPSEVSDITSTFHDVMNRVKYLEQTSKSFNTIRLVTFNCNSLCSKLNLLCNAPFLVQHRMKLVMSLNTSCYKNKQNQFLKYKAKASKIQKSIVKGVFIRNYPELSDEGIHSSSIESY